MLRNNKGLTESDNIPEIPNVKPVKPEKIMFCDKDKDKEEYEANLSAIRKCAEIGLSETDTANMIEMEAGEFYKWKRKDDNVRAALDVGASMGRQSIAATMYAMATQERDSKMLIWLSQNRLGYSGKSENKNDSTGKMEIDFSSKSTEQLAQAYKILSEDVE